jgi:hypothetical protein
VFNPYSPEYKKLNPTEENKNESEKKSENNENSQNNQNNNMNNNNNNANNQNENNENEDNNKDFLEKAETYIRIRIMLSQPVNPVLPDVELPDPIYYIKKEKAPKNQ